MLSRVGSLSPRHGSNDGRIELFARKYDVEMFRSYYLAFLLSFAERALRKGEEGCED